MGRRRLTPNKGICDLCGDSKTGIGQIRNGTKYPKWFRNSENRDQIVCLRCYRSIRWHKYSNQKYNSAICTMKARTKVIRHYSNNTMRCACCGESEYLFLTLEHINGGGNKHRLRVGNVWRWLVRNGFPDGYKILCFNCNCALAFFGYCPHQLSRQESVPMEILGV
jgi:hypothetical protein